MVFAPHDARRFCRGAARRALGGALAAMSARYLRRTVRQMRPLAGECGAQLTYIARVRPTAAGSSVRGWQI